LNQNPFKTLPMMKENLKKKFNMDISTKTISKYLKIIGYIKKKVVKRLLCEGLKVNTTLRSLSMGYNGTTNEICSEAICSMIKINRTLNAIYISDLDINVKSLWNALKGNPSIYCLFFSRNNNLEITNLCDRNRHNIKLKNMSLLEFLDK
jgi:hypothetical protein